MTTHPLKTWVSVYPAVASGAKSVEIRKDDRGGYTAGDRLVLQEFDPARAAYTGRSCVRTVTHVLAGGAFGLESGYVALSIAHDEEDRHA